MENKYYGIAYKTVCNVKKEVLLYFLYSKEEAEKWLSVEYFNVSDKKLVSKEEAINIVGKNYFSNHEFDCDFWYMAENGLLKKETD